MIKRYIIIEGGIGAGKTTLLNILQQRYYLDAKFIYEYIEEDTGKKMLKNFLERKTSVVAFQYYIANYWLHKLEEASSSNLIFMERGPLAGLAFCKEEDFVSKQQYDDFIYFLKFIMKKNQIGKLKFVCINPNENINNVLNIINGSADNIVLFIAASSKLLRERVIKRGREGEVEEYSSDFLIENANKLSNIYLHPNEIIKDLIN